MPIDTSGAVDIAIVRGAIADLSPDEQAAIVKLKAAIEDYRDAKAEVGTLAADLERTNTALLDARTRLSNIESSVKKLQLILIDVVSGEA